VFSLGDAVLYNGSVWEIFDVDTTDDKIGFVLGPADWKGGIEDEVPTIICRDLFALRPVLMAA
jgi:hypothetical protein